MNQIIIIYSPIVSARLNYILKFIFEEQFGITYKIETHKTIADHKNLTVINYSNDVLENAKFSIVPHGLLLEKGIKAQNTTCFFNDEFKAFFKTENSDLTFDIFSASFYLLSRYEEYLPYTPDEYGRYPHTESLAFKEGFIKTPLVNYWLNFFKEKLLEKYPQLAFKEQKFKFLPTYDLDISYSYKGKGFFKNIVGFLKNPKLERINVLLGKQQDPYDSYAFLDLLHHKHNTEAVYFFLLSQKINNYDKNILPQKLIQKRLIEKISANNIIGIHPSWHSFLKQKIVEEEKNILQNISGKPVSKSRQHYIKFILPKSFEILIANKITDDYSMGYGSINGFRASAASPFYWYNLETETETNLRIHPFCFMEANCFYIDKLSIEAAREEMNYFFETCKNANGLFISIFHNQFLGTDKMFDGYKNLYENFFAEKV